ncbi:DUF2715 domain-containing protein [Treponema vincentii]|uniref:DUF2715 domain-containing protein n=1 Tax=Treponema vincentii TaxID=69710 RepID=UPI0020A38D10|nr:DUF2715 domain-containing protein [Treponema vincentii]UTC47857.1 DUF2715 domain-containing protein [Treponema vincentii]
MKKIAIMLFCLALVSAHAFAEFVMVPGLGLSYYSGSTGEKSSVSMLPFGVGLDFSYLTDSGFTLCMDNDFQYFAKITYTVESNSTGQSVSKGLAWNSRIMPGYTFKFAKDKAYLRLAGGPAIGTFGYEVETEIKVGDEKVKTKTVHTAMTVGLAFHVGFEYYFTNMIGIGISINEIPTLYSDASVGNANIFNLKIGPSFRLGAKEQAAKK